MKNLNILTPYNILIVIVFLFHSSTSQDDEKFKKPNVILIMTDDQGYGDLAAHGNPYIKTPHLDKLYAESTRFTVFHVNSFCAPTRAALMTGRMSDRTQVHSTVYVRNHLAKEEITMADYFKASGYHTGHFGKWHLGDNYPYRPMDRGFDEWVGIGDGGVGTANDYWGNDRMDDAYLRNGKWEKIKGFNTDVFFDETIDFIEKSKDEPFFIYLATNVPHGPMNVLPEWREEYEGMDFKMRTVPWGDTKDLFASITRVDQNIGRLRQYLADNELDENTIIIFLTDNGSSDGTHVFNDGMRGSKGSLYDGGHRVPCFVHWPAGGFNKAVDIDKFTAHIDLLPTLINICHLDNLEKSNLAIDGRSLEPLLKNPETEWEDRVIINHVQNIVDKQIKDKNIIVYTDQWRLINKNALYDINADPGQKNNVAEAYPDIVAELSKKYDDYWDELQMDDYPYPRPIIGTEYQEEVWLNSISWIREDLKVHSWNQSHVLAGEKAIGFWPVEISQEGPYHFDVRRWPKEVNLPLASALPEAAYSDISTNGKPIKKGAGKGIPVTKVRLKVGTQIIEKAVEGSEVGAEFIIDLPAGQTEVQAWLIDGEGNEQSAYYAYVKKV
ncbi:arylsulfatase [Portibacter lacus]|uniref:N-acetylgalactosamine-6-sulfatase n=1 Tax=Portibacter lacus TaxID=1099794 RepID=A0AA37SUI5_9BACT|nr:arylsulfatase [Portibacter lacus]GLR19959.1 N-acetylgalactosamine-6-sulfatase [Portibacter lacus]